MVSRAGIVHIPKVGKDRLIYDLNRICNDRARLDHGLRVTLGALNIGKAQADKIVKGVRLADFALLEKTMKINQHTNNKRVEK